MPDTGLRFGRCCASRRPPTATSPTTSRDGLAFEQSQFWSRSRPSRSRLHSSPSSGASSAGSTSPQPSPSTRATRVRVRLPRRHWEWLACGLLLAFALPYLLTDLAHDQSRRLLRHLLVRGLRVLRALAALRRRPAAGAADSQLALGRVARCGSRRRDRRHPLHREGDAASARSGFRRRDHLARRRLRRRRRRPALGLPDPRRRRRLLEPAATRAQQTRASRNRRSGARRLAPVHGGLPPRLSGFPRRKGAQAADRRRRLERPHTRHPQSDRRATRPHRPPRQRRRPRLRHRHLPASPPEDQH